eukprot:COSAG02_NODE_2305_length_9181_cov_3.277001_6_plen_232_part_00
MLPAERRLGQILGTVGVGTALSWVGLRMASGGIGAPPTMVTSLARAETKAPSDALSDPDFPSDWPYSADDLRRRDETSDTRFYDQPRLVTHIDDSAIAALTSFYSQQPVFAARPADVALLDIASSWISHYPSSFDGSAGRVALLGMNQYELEQNRQGTERVVKDLNDEPSLPYGDEEFDAVTIAVSVDYLAQPLEVFREINRVLKRGTLLLDCYCAVRQAFSSDGQTVHGA